MFPTLTRLSLRIRRLQTDPQLYNYARFQPDPWKYVNQMENLNAGSRNADARRQNRRKRDEDPHVLVSKALSSVLRHNADKFGLKMRPDGYARLDDLLALQKFRGQTFESIKSLVDSSDKQRFALTEETDASGRKAWWIRANQGHSMKEVSIEMRELIDASSIPMAVHGTSHGAWNSILRQGLSRMNRQHIHFAQGLAGDTGVISGMRKTSSVLIFIDVARAMHAGIKFYVSANEVVLTPGNDRGFVPPEFFSRVEATSGKTLEGFDGPRQPTAHASAQPLSAEGLEKKVIATESIADDEEDAQAAWAAIADKAAALELKGEV